MMSTWKSQRRRQEETTAHFQRLIQQNRESDELLAKEQDEYSSKEDSVEDEKELETSNSIDRSNSESSELSLPKSFQLYQREAHDIVIMHKENNVSTPFQYGSNDMLRRFYEIQVRKLLDEQEKLKRAMEVLQMSANEEKVKSYEEIERMKV